MKQKEAKLNSSHNNNTSPSNTTGDLSTLPAAKTSPPAGTVAEFEEENKYIKNQLSQLQWAPFSIPRLCELLLSPATHHLNKDGVLRGDALQASLRRCVLVLYPFHAPAETAPSG
ncbi:hypothetical protein AGDE_04070 [Angomonas deanei]|uniref:Uncharacterized protein n=1 Tax=Angomonas deanei TaxID=59799 RepID=A0A7G2CE93_9TRYP|nr:hypothetical protein AGDE_04070 [Angomonas deanei]CAD2217297.1 hypothetical protein, conserved [Angomonas deanei]|eukprot:EPY39858.1 hypothetical protein AGDE_04070 [Angomonas deanei]